MTFIIITFVLITFIAITSVLMTVRPFIHETFVLIILILQQTFMTFAVEAFKSIV